MTGTIPSGLALPSADAPTPLATYSQHLDGGLQLWDGQSDASVVALTARAVSDPSAEWFGALVQHSSDLIAVVDEDGTVVYANPVTEVAFGVAVEDAIGTSAFAYVHPGDVDRLAERLAGLLRTPGSSHTETLRFVSASGETRVLETVSTNCLHVPTVAGIVINGRDVTERNSYMARLEASLDAVVVSVANAVELRDPYTAGHLRQVADVAVAIAKELSLTAEEIKGIGVAGTLHDIGKIAIPAEILTRPGHLTDPEYEIVKTHSLAGAHIVANVPFPWPIATMILQHHERLDGSGYPDGLQAQDILLGSRIVAVADVVSAMSAHRPYRPALGHDAALDELDTNAGRLYDTDVVRAYQNICRDRSI